MHQILLLAVFVKSLFIVQVVTDLIANAVNHYARVVAGLLNHGACIGLPPLVKIEVVSLLGMVLGRVPRVKRLGHHQKSHPVAEVHQHRVGRVVGHPYGVHAQLA